MLESLQKNNPEIVLQAVVGPFGNLFCDLDASKPPFDDVRVRRAMQMAIDLEGIDRDFYKGTSVWQPQGIVGEGYQGVFHSHLKSGPKRSRAAIGTIRQGRKLCWMRPDIRAARTALRFKTTLNLPAALDLGYSELSATYWAEIGVDVEINPLDGAGANAAARRDRTWEGLIWQPLGWNGDPIGFVRNMVHSSSHEDLTRNQVP